MSLKLNDRETTQVAVPNATTSGALTATAINATGFGRARFVFNFGSNTGGASVAAAGIGIYQASSSGAPYTSLPNAVLAAVSSGALSNVVAVIDTVISSGTPWLEVSGAVVNSSIIVGATVDLYNGTRTYPATALEQQVVSV